MRKGGSNINFGNFFIPKPNFQVIKIFQVLELKFSLTSPLSISIQSIFIQTWKLFLHWTFHETDQPTLDCIHIFHPKLMKVISFLNETCFMMIQHVNLNLHIHVSNLRLLGQNFSSTHEIGYLGCMTSLSVLASNHLKFSWKALIMYKPYRKSHLSFQIVSNTCHFYLSSCVSSPSPTTNGWWGFKSW